MNLQRVSLLAARRRDAATVQLVCWRSRRQVPSLGNSRPHGFCARGCGVLLGFYAPIVAELLALCPWRQQTRLGAGKDRIPFVLGHDSEEMDRELGGRR